MFTFNSSFLTTPRISITETNGLWFEWPIYALLFLVDQFSSPRCLKSEPMAVQALWTGTGNNCNNELTLLQFFGI